MASACSRIAQRTSLGSIKSAITKSNVSTCCFSRSAFPKSTSTLGLGRSGRNRIAPQLGCLQSMLPLHSAVAAATMTSCLCTNSRTFRALSQGTLCCISLGP